MNKKRLSVVMAGAMLASSVAPVLAAETMPMDQRGLVLDAVRKLMKENLLEGNRDYVDESAVGFTIVEKGKSDKDINGKVLNLKNSLADLAELKKAYSKDMTVRVYKKATRLNDAGKLTDEAANNGETIGKESTYKDVNALNGIEKTIKDAVTAGNKFVERAEWVTKDASGQAKKEDGMKVILNAVEDPNASEPVKKVVILKVGDKVLDFDAPIDSKGYKLDAKNKDDVQKFDHFAVKVDKVLSTSTDKLEGIELLNEIDLVGEASNSDAIMVSDLYDGLMLTDKGVELLDALKSDKVNDHKKLDVELKTGLSLLPGIYGFNIEVKDYDKLDKNGDPTVRTITVRGTNEKDSKMLANWLTNKDFTVGKLSGTNRFDTAVKIAKEQASITEVAKGGHIVLVNGEALVDGLAAAPLADSLVNGAGAAPILLTKNNSIPKETLSYLKDLVAAQKINELNQIHINIVGGEAVVSKEIVETLEGIGFDVVRYGGDNREETSIEVFDAINEPGRDKIYLVGADGEADAMSISPKAADNGTIIVSKRGGLSKVALRAIEKAKQDVIIVGGETLVSAADEAKLKEIAEKNGKKVERVAGKNRKATNAAIIEKYYNFGSKAVVVAKDGQSNKMDLVDALTVANLATQLEAPIVLATDKLSNEQLNQVNLKAANANRLYQIGGGVSRPVMEKLAELLELPKEF